MQSTTAGRTNDISIVLREFHLRVLQGGGGEHHKGHRSVIYAGDSSSAVEWRQIKLRTSCDVPAPLNQRRTIIVDVSRSIFVPMLVSCPDQEPFPKMLPGRS